MTSDGRERSGAHDKRSRSDRSYHRLLQRGCPNGAGGCYILVIVWTERLLYDCIFKEVLLTSMLSEQTLELRFGGFCLNKSTCKII